MKRDAEQGVIGNGQLLATIGKRGELRHLFWPTIDYPQHILGSLPGIYYSKRDTSRFDWLTDSPWEQKQEYVADTNILLSYFKNSEAGLDVKATDFVLPEANILIRNFSFLNSSSNDVFLRFFYYNDLAISETDIDDVAYYLPGPDVIIHYKRNVYFLYGSPTKSSGHQCGVHGESSDAFNDVYDSKLSGGSLVLYDGSRAVNSCLSWDMGNIEDGESKNLMILTALGSNEKEALNIFEENHDIGIDALVKRTEDYWRKWISSFTRDFGSEKVNKIMRRSLLLLKLLIDRNHGGIVAAPCMEPEYRFCWPRDATYVAYALDLCGFHEEPEKFYKWCQKAQEKEGGLYQRYYIEAKLRGPCWSSQIDEIATVVWGIGKNFELTKNYSFLKSMWSTIKQAANFICDCIDPKTYFTASVGLWEERLGSHTYSNAAVCRALKTSATIAKLLGKNKLYQKWLSLSNNIQNSLLTLTWDSAKNRFIKTYEPRDENLDVSLLGLTFPFEVLSADEDKMKKTANAIEQAFNYEVGGVGRYPGDSYYEGNPWILSVLWLSLYYEELGDINRAKRLIDWATSKSTDLDLLAEQVDKNSGVPVSAVPLAWSHAFFIISVMGLNDLVFPKHQNAPQDKSRSKLMPG
jgi:glucoamylase